MFEYIRCSGCSSVVAEAVGVEKDGVYKDWHRYLIGGRRVLLFTGSRLLVFCEICCHYTLIVIEAKI